MDAKEKTLTTFSTRVRQLILQFRELKAENNELYAMVDERDKKIKELESQVAQKQTEYESLKTAKMLEITDGDLDGAKKRVARLIREVNKCHVAERIKAMAETNKAKQHITLHVYDTNLSVYCEPEKEVLYRNAAKKITETVNQYAQIFKGRKSDKDILYMSLIDIALRYEMELDRNETQPYDQLLSQLTTEIEEELKNK